MPLPSAVPFSSHWVFTADPRDREHLPHFTDAKAEAWGGPAAAILSVPGALGWGSHC